jgi:hypothetical protein
VEPLGTAENNIADLNDYEVDDIIFHLEIEYDFQKKYYPKKLSKTSKKY